METNVLKLLTEAKYQWLRDKIINKINHNQEPDVRVYTWATIPYSLKIFWALEFRNDKKEN